MTLELTEVASDLKFPEGPVAMPDGSVLFVEIEGQTLSRVTPGEKPVVVADLKGGPNGVAIGPDKAAYVCNNGGVYSFVQMGGQTVPNPHRPNYTHGTIQRVDLDTGAVTTLFGEDDDTRLIAPDDIVFDEHGGFYFTDTGLQDETTLRLGGLYYATPDRKIFRHLAQIPTANGVGLSPDGKTVYVSDTIFGRLWALDITAQGEVAPPKLPGLPGHPIQTLPSTPNLPWLQWVDSLKVEQDGRICVGTIFNGGITVFQLDGTTEHFPVDAMFTTNLCFGGADMRDVWITASSTGKIYKARWPRPGLKLNWNPY